MKKTKNTSIRNAVARLSIMRKGGVHDKTNKAKRSKHKQKLQKQIRTDSSPYLFLETKKSKMSIQIRFDIGFESNYNVITI